MNPRDMDAYYDAFRVYTEAKIREDPELLWAVESDVTAGKTYRLGRWNLDQAEDVRYADERAWITDAFKAETTYLTEERDKYPGFAPKRPKRKPVRHEDLQAGDTAQLDSFLAGFVK